MIIHTTDTGVRYEVNISQEEIDRRMAELIRKLYPTWLEQRAPARGAESRGEVVGTSPLPTEYDPGCVATSQPRTRVQEGVHE